MVMHPEVQRKAQVEIDRVIGSDRFPTMADQPSLPYVDALVKEVHRWNPVAPLGTFTVFCRHGLPFSFVPREADCRAPGIPHTATEETSSSKFDVI